VKQFLVILTLFTSIGAIASESLTHFKTRFRLIRDEESRAIRIIDRSLHTKLNFSKFSQTYHDWFISESPSLLEGTQFLSPEAEIESRELNRELRQILEEVRKFKLQKLILSNSFLKINNFLTKEFKKVSTVGFRTVSNLENTTFFFQNKQYKKIEESAKKEVAKYFPGEIDERVVAYLVERYIGFLKDSRTYHQSILLHYLTNFSPLELSMTEEEVGMAISSILEGDIKKHNIFSRRRLKKNWTTYGVSKLKEVQKESIDRVVKFRERYSVTPYFANPFFAQTKTTRGEEVWISPYFQNKALDNSPSLTFDYTRPEFVYKSRRYYELILFASSQDKRPNRVKKYFTHLMYRRQMLKEGLLYGFYEARGDFEMTKKLLKQSLNPLETLFEIPN